MKFAILFVVLVFAQVGVVRAQSASYECPMHPGITYTKPGKCPKCGMTLVKKTAGRKAAAKSAAEKPAKAAEAPAQAVANSDAFSSSKIPNAEVSDQNGNALNFYTD